MSLDAGGLAQMTYNNQNGFGASGLGMPTGSFASRGKGAQLKRLSLSPVGENNVEAPTPRTSRSHLLAGLRTAPKSQNGPIPASAPYHQTQHRNMPNNQYAPPNTGFGGMPQTAIGNSFGLNSPQQYGVPEPQYPLSHQVLAPPSLQFDQDDEQMDPAILAQLLQTEQYLAQRQRMLQQQLLSLTTGQFQGMNMNGNGFGMSPPYPQTPMTPPYGRQMNGMGMNNPGPIIQEVPNQPGLLMVISPQTGEVNYMMDPSFQNQQQQQQQQQTRLANSPPPPTPSYTNSPPRVSTPAHEKWGHSRSVSPPKKTSSPPQDVEPLPPPSANAFRRGHKFPKSIVTDGTPQGLKSAGRMSGLPTTPVTGTFGPGQNRAGEHPVRQPRGPPSIEELVAKPTSKHEGSKNFATRQRRRAVHSLVRAGKERRGVRSGSGGSMSPVSETDGFALTSDNDSESVRSSGSLSGKNSIGSLRAQASGAIGCERRAKKEGSVDSLSSHGSAGKAEIRLEEPPKTSTPMLVLTSAETRKTWVS